MRSPYGDPWIFQFWRVIARGLKFAFIGPAIGAFFSPGILVLPLAIVLAYMTSIAPAFATGCCVAIASAFIKRPVTLYAFAGLIGAAFSAPVGLLLGNSPMADGMVVVHAISGAFAATVCTWVTENVWLSGNRPAN